MARPKKDPGEKRDKRLTLYLTSTEYDQLNLLAEASNLDKTKIMNRALQQHFKTLEEPPPALRLAKQEQIMNQDKLQVSGYVCANGHPFWIESVWPSPPEYCPCCGDKNIKSAWGGITRKGI